MDSCLHRLNWLLRNGRKNEGIYWQDLFGQRDATKTTWMSNESASSASSSSPRKINKKIHRGLLKSVIKLLPSIIKKVARHDHNSSSFFSSSSFVFLILLSPPLLALESAPTPR